MKEEEPIKIEIEEEAVKAESDSPDFAEELRRFGQKFAETVENAWNSEQRQKLEEDLKEGMNRFSEEVRKAFDKVSETDAAKKVREEAAKIDSTELAGNIKKGLASGLRWLSTELGKFSDVLEKEAPEEEADTSAEM